ncbi:hypothetical protein BP6252_03969 [Coleophoma cylindrospora]|uniref:Amino acid transporter transmembrane domain-containing protein n=1 Tax=Coleophoma cylindrospora TaxID=1849047 RepID=A0A3D8S926_9HELO|nr:hypothetical protein BP6252_03969 [Coleophoma cylindrospora]
MSLRKVSSEKYIRNAEIAAAAPIAFPVEEYENKEREVFEKKDGVVDFRTVGWPRATGIFLKVIFATGVLSIPTAFASLGAVPGVLSVIGWGALNTYLGVILGNFRAEHPSNHSIADMAGMMGGPILKEMVGALFVIAWILGTGSGIVGIAVALNTFSNHAACTVWWCFLAAFLIAAMASVRTFHAIGWLTWTGFISIFIAVLIVVIGVTLRDRPAGAPQTGPYELGFLVIGHPTFQAGITASATIFVSSAGPVAFVPVIAEMRSPEDYKKALFSCMGFVHASYICFALVVYKWCGTWVTSPSLGSAGPTLQKVSYGVGVFGLLVSGALGLHVAAKFLFVRILRNSRHLQSNTLIHWGTWLSCTFGLCAISFILAEAVPIFNYLLALTGSLCFAPLQIALPGCLYLFQYRNTYKAGTALQKTIYYAHFLLPLLGAFMCAGGTYGVVQSIIDAYANGTVGGVFSCANDSGIV